MNTIGEQFRFTSFGESHGRAIGGVLDGVPAGLHIDMDHIREALLRRAGGSTGTSSRAAAEKDEVEWLSGIADGVTLGTPIAFLIRNTDARPQDYLLLQHSYRDGHADWVYEKKYGLRDWRGGGRASARETAARVVAGSIAQQQLRQKGIAIQAQLIQVGMETNIDRFDELIRSVQKDGDSIGGIIQCTITGLPAGIGEPIFDKLSSHLAAAMLSINGCKGFDYDLGFNNVRYRGSELYAPPTPPATTTFSLSTPLSTTDSSSLSAFLYSTDSISGGISTGNPIIFRAVFKPTATIAKYYKGRHDVCIAIRAVPVVEAMTALVLADFVLSM